MRYTTTPGGGYTMYAETDQKRHDEVMAYQASLGGFISIPLKAYRALLELPEARRILTP